MKLEFILFFRLYFFLSRDIRSEPSSIRFLACYDWSIHPSLYSKCFELLFRYFTESPTPSMFNDVRCANIASSLESASGKGESPCHGQTTTKKWSACTVNFNHSNYSIRFFIDFSVLLNSACRLPATRFLLLFHPTAALHCIVRSWNLWLQSLRIQ